MTWNVGSHFLHHSGMGSCKPPCMLRRMASRRHTRSQVSTYPCCCLDKRSDWTSCPKSFDDRTQEQVRGGRLSISAHPLGLEAYIKHSNRMLTDLGFAFATRDTRGLHASSFGCLSLALLGIAVSRLAGCSVAGHCSSLCATEDGKGHTPAPRWKNASS